MDIAKKMIKKNLKKYIIYLDMNNLYGHAMSQYLPYANFKWVKNIDKVEQSLMQIKKDSSNGYILEVDLEYPKNCRIFIMIIH